MNYWGKHMKIFKLAEVDYVHSVPLSPEKKNKIRENIERYFQKNDPEENHEFSLSPWTINVDDENLCTFEAYFFNPTTKKNNLYSIQVNIDDNGKLINKPSFLAKIL